MRKVFYYLGRFSGMFFLILTFSLFSCKQIKKPAAETERENWITSLSDSIKKYNDSIEIIKTNLAETVGKTDSLLTKFSYQEKQREVEGYYILKGWENRYPLTKTGIIARIDKSENVEIIAALATGARFNHIALMSEGETYRSDTVPHDQALNYFDSPIDRVCFMNEKAAGMASFIAVHKNDPVEIIFMENSAKVGNLNIPTPEKEMIAETFALYNARNQTRILEQKLRILQGRINVCRAMTDSINK